MSVLVSGPRRVFVLLLLWERLADVGVAGCRRVLTRLEQAIGASPHAPQSGWAGPGWHQTIWIRLQRVLWGRLVGLHLFVLEPDGRTDARAPRP
jgi:hypothetical protein